MHFLRFRAWSSTKTSLLSSEFWSRTSLFFCFVFSVFVWWFGFVRVWGWFQPVSAFRYGQLWGGGLSRLRLPVCRRFVSLETAGLSAVCFAWDCRFVGGLSSLRLPVYFWVEKSSLRFSRRTLFTWRSKSPFSKSFAITYCSKVVTVQE